MNGYFRIDASVRPGARHLAIAVLVVATAILLSGHSVVGWMLSKTKGIGWNTPDGSIGKVANQHVDEFFPARMRGAIVMAVEAKPGTPSVLTQAVQDFSVNVSDRVRDDSRIRPYAPIVVGYYLNHELADGVRKQVQAQLVTPDLQMTLIVIQATKLEGQWNDAAKFLEEFCASPPPGFTLHITGMMSVLSGDGCFNSVHGKVNTRSMNFDGLFRAEVITIPVALIIIGALVKFYIKLLLLPVLMLLISFIVFAAMMIPWMDTFKIPKDAPAATGSVMLALSLDYGLFFLTRFSEQHRQGWPLQRNVDSLLAHTGKTITISGGLVAISFFASMTLPEENIQGTGFAMGIACIAGVVTTLVLLPAVLLLFGRILTGGIVRTPVDIDMQGFGGREELMESMDYSQHEQKETSHWLRVMRIMDTAPYVVMGCVMILMSPAFLSLPSLSITADRFAMMPMDMPAMSALRRVEQSFPVGILDPYAVVVTAPPHLASARLSREVQAGMRSLGGYDVKSMAKALGIKEEDASAFASAVHSLSHGDVDGDVFDSVNCKKMAAVGAGVALGMERTDGSSDAHALKSALRAAQKTGCSSSDIQDAVSASASLLVSQRDKIMDGEYAKKPVRYDHAEMEKAVHDEALKLGLSPDAATHLAKSASIAASGKYRSDEHQSTVAAVQAGRAVGIGKLHGHSDIDSLKSSLNELQGMDISVGDASQIIRAAMLAVQKGAHAAEGAGKTIGEDSGAALSAAGQGALATHADLQKDDSVKKSVQAEAMKDGLNEHAASAVAEVVQKGTKAVEKGEEGNKKTVKEEATKGGLIEHDASVVAAALAVVAKHGDKGFERPKQARDVAAEAKAGMQDAVAQVQAESAAPDKEFTRRWRQILDIVGAVERLSGKDHGVLLMPSGFDAMLDLCQAIQGVGNVASMLAPTWAFHQRVDWVAAVAMHLNSKANHMYQPLLASHVNGHRALVEVHTTFPSIGSGGADWVLDVRRALADWETNHPGYKAELAGGAAEFADMRTSILSSMWTYLSLTVVMVMSVVFLTFRSLMVPLRLGLALLFTLAATYGVAVIVYQTPLLHGLFPWLAPFHGLTFEVVPMVTGVCIALGLDYDIFLVTRIVEFRMQGYTDRASVFRGAAKAGGVISGAGLIMSLAFTGLCFSDKLLFQQFGVLLITSVLFDTFVVRTVLVPCLMLIAQEWNWWPRQMPPAYKAQIEGDESIDNDSQDLHYRAMYD
jgi:uncharacterized membrane protein YdfJ with MMPL/SSD domain